MQRRLTRVVVFCGLALCLAMLSRGQAFAQVPPSNPARAMVSVADSLLAAGRVDFAKELFDFVIRVYPNSDAAIHAAEVLESLSRQPGHGNGNTELIVFNTFYGATLGVLVPAAFGANAPEPYGLGLLLGAPLGYGLSRWYTSAHPVTSGQARAMTFGTWWGALQGLGWREVFDIGDRTERYCYDFEGERQCYDVGTVSDDAPYVATIIGGVTGLAAGTVIGRGVPISGSTALITNFSALWGGWYGAVLGVQLDPKNDDEFSDDDDDGLVATMLIAGNVGLLAGAVAGPKLGWSSGDAWAVHLSGIAGLIGGLGIDLLANVETTETGMLIPGLTSAAALITAGVLVSGKNPSLRRPSGQGGVGALINYRDGAWTAGTPLPMPSTVSVVEYGQRRHELGVQLPLLSMRW